MSDGSARYDWESLPLLYEAPEPLNWVNVGMEGSDGLWGKPKERFCNGPGYKPGVNSER